MVRDCDTGLCAASAKEKAIAYFSTIARCRCNSKLSSDGSTRAQRKTLGIPAECLVAPMTQLLFKCPRIKGLVRTNLNIDLADIDKLPDRVTFSRCPYCSAVHGWRPNETWISEDVQAKNSYVV